jgi:ABC-type transport system substrate-binding protein
VNGKFIGTGAYVIEDLGSEKLRLTPNPYFPTPPKNSILLSSIVGADTINDLENGDVDAVAYVMASTVSSDGLKAQSNLSTVVGQDALHRALYMNAQKGRLFANAHFRLALQYLIYEYLKNKPEFIGDPAYTSFDMQVYLPLQSGRLDEKDVTALIEKGKPYVQGLLEGARKNPPVLIETKENSMRMVLEAIGIELSSKSRSVDKSTIIDIIYKGEEADLIPGNFGIASGDPDGIFHKLGRSGAIASPMTNNTAVAELLEEGRRLIHKEELDPFYKKVNRKILEEAPFVHLGFNKAISVYRNDRIKVERNLLRRNEGDLQVFEAVE